MEANRLEAQRCVEIAREALRAKDCSKAVKFLQKANKQVRLYFARSFFFWSLLDAERFHLAADADLLKKAQNMGSSNGGYHATGTDAGYGHYDQYEADSADEGSSSSVNEPKQRTRSRSAARPQVGVHYTKEELEIVERLALHVNCVSCEMNQPKNNKNIIKNIKNIIKGLLICRKELMGYFFRIRHCKDYYEILNVKKNANETDLKREYRKLALQLHPDKCRAPGATEAFKALGNAYAVLSNKEKRAQYDLYGAEGPRRRSSHYEDEFSEYDYGRGFEAEFTPEEIFNMFFGGGYPAGHLNRRQRGAHYHFQHHSTQQEQPSYASILQLLPLFGVLLLGLIAQLMVGDPAFSLHRTRCVSEVLSLSKKHLILQVALSGQLLQPLCSLWQISNRFINCRVNIAHHPNVTVFS
ncbi:unnamed protein product [Gongylonema pulchrum]|uniref:J domain-containing protein n=1 Tax=Gongylonema pulchrum TaxID=637853 RepID=A0A183E0P7_9BILA|nr:unnamed protein product [Gongylonema pulchrum]